MNYKTFIKSLSASERLFMVALNCKCSPTELAVVWILLHCEGYKIERRTDFTAKCNEDGSRFWSSWDRVGKGGLSLLPVTRQAIHKAVTALRKRGWVELSSKGYWDHDPAVALLPLAVLADAPAGLRPATSIAAAGAGNKRGAGSSGTASSGRNKRGAGSSGTASSGRNKRGASARAKGTQ